MSQEEVINYMRLNTGAWLSAKDIAVKINAHTEIVRKNLRKLYEYKEVNREESKNRMGGLLFKYKIKNGS